MGRYGKGLASVAGRSFCLIVGTASTCTPQTHQFRLAINFMNRNMPKRKLTFVVAVNNRDVLQNNLLASPCFRKPHGHQIIIQEGFNSAAKAYNDATDRAQNELMVFVHQDIILPEQWLNQVEDALQHLEEQDPSWGVLGCYGKTQTNEGRGWVYQSGPGMIGAPFENPVPVQTLDEIVLILRRSSHLRFDEGLPHFHLYGTDICLRAKESGRTSYAIPAFCIHNSSQGFVLPKEFYECYWHVRRAWSSQLPIQASCIRITRLNLAMYKRRLSEIYFRYRRPHAIKGRRVQDIRQLVKEADIKIEQKVEDEATSHCTV